MNKINQLAQATLLTAALSTAPVAAEWIGKAVEAGKAKTTAVLECGKLKTQLTSQELLQKCIADKSTKLEVWDQSEELIVQSREQLFALMSTNWYSQDTIDQALTDYDFLMQEKEWWMLVKHELVSWYESKSDLRSLVNDGNLLPEASFVDFLPEGDTELTAKNYEFTVKALSDLSDTDIWLKVWKWENTEELNETQLTEYKKNIKKFTKLYTRLPKTWDKQVTQGVLDPQAFQNFIDLFNQSKDNIVFSSRETLRRLLVTSASITKYTHLVSEDESQDKWKTVYLNRAIKPNISSQVWEYSMLTKSEENNSSALKVTYSYEWDTKNGTRVYAYLPEQKLTELSQSLYSNDLEKTNIISGSSHDSMLVLQDRVGNFKKRHASYLKRMELIANKTRIAQERETTAQEKFYLQKMWDIMDQSMVVMANIEDFVKTGSIKQADTEFETLNELKKQAIVLNDEIWISSENFRKMYVTYVSWLDKLEKKYTEKSQLLSSL